MATRATNMKEFLTSFAGILTALSLVIAALPAVFSNTTLIPALDLGENFAQHAQVLISISCYLCIAIVFNYRDFLGQRYLSDKSRPKILRLLLNLAPIIFFILTFISIGLSYLAGNNGEPGSWPIFAATGIFAFPVLVLSFIAVKELSVKNVDPA